MPLTHRQQKLLRHCQSRHGRRKHGVYLCEGLRCCQEAVARLPAADILAAIYTSAFADTAAGQRLLAQLPPAVGAQVDSALLASSAATQNPQGIALLCRYPQAAAPPALLGDPFLLVLDRVTEPGNLGTILRTAWAVGLSQVWLTAGSTDPFGPKAIRAGMGAQFALTLSTFADLQAVRAAAQSRGIERVYLAMPASGVSCYSPEFELHRSAVVIGNEAWGVQDCAGALAVTIPMPGNAESLNAAQAATILLFEGVRRGLLTR